MLIIDVLMIICELLKVTFVTKECNFCYNIQIKIILSKIVYSNSFSTAYNLGMETFQL